MVKHSLLLLLLWVGAQACDPPKNPGPGPTSTAGIPSAPSNAASSRPVPSATSGPIDPATWRRDQPRLGHFVVHRGEHVIGSEKNRFYVVDWEKQALKPFVSPCPQTDLVLDGALICQADGKRHVQLDVGGRYRKVELPDPLAAPDQAIVGDAHAGTLALMRADQLHLYAKGRWSRHDIGPAPKRSGTMGIPSHVHLTTDRIFVGYDRGEWGGGLFALELDQPAWTAVHDVGDNALDVGVQRIVSGPQGATWALFGLAHLSLREGFLVRFDKGQPQLVAKNTQAPFPFEDADFEAMAFDEQGALYLASGGRGLLRRRGGRWEHLTPAWSTFVYQRDLAVRDGVAALAMYDAGIVFIDLSTRVATRRALPE